MLQRNSSRYREDNKKERGHKLESQPPRMGDLLKQVVTVVLGSTMRLSVSNTSELHTSKNTAKVRVYCGETRGHHTVNIRTTHQGTAVNGVMRLSAGGTSEPQI